MFKICDLIRQYLSLIQPDFNLMDKNISRPAVLYGCIRIPDMLFRSFNLIHQRNIMIPCNLCKHLLHNFSVRKTGGKSKAHYCAAVISRLIFSTMERDSCVFISTLITSLSYNSHPILTYLWFLLLGLSGKVI